MKKFMRIISALQIMTIILASCGAPQNNTTVETSVLREEVPTVSAPAESSEIEIPYDPDEGKIKIPDIKDVDESTAKNVLSALGLIPAIKYEYDNNSEIGVAFKTSPNIGSMVEKSTKITVYISKGPKKIDAKNATISWYKSEFVDISFSTPYINEGTLYIKCESDAPAEAFSWKDSYGEGSGFGEASLNDTFSKNVPIIITYDSKYASVKKKEHVEFTLEIPLNELEANRPTDIYVKMSVLDKKGNYKQYRLSFTMTW